MGSSINSVSVLAELTNGNDTACHGCSHLSAIEAIDASPQSQYTYCVFATSQSIGVAAISSATLGYGLQAILTNANDAPKAGADHPAAVYAWDQSGASSYSYGMYATSYNTAVAGIALPATSTGEAAYFQGGSSGTNSCSYRGGMAWECTNSKLKSENFSATDPGHVLDQVAALPEWKYQLKDGDPKAWFMGPMAEDFYAAFGLGTDDTKINSANVEGVALTAIKGLNLKVEAALKAKDAEIAKLQAANGDLRAQLVSLKSGGEDRLKRLEAAVMLLSHGHPVQQAAAMGR